LIDRCAQGLFFFKPFQRISRMEDAAVVIGVLSFVGESALKISQEN
jgi:hypothetical protein